MRVDLQFAEKSSGVVERAFLQGVWRFPPRFWMVICGDLMVIEVN